MNQEAILLAKEWIKLHQKSLKKYKGEWIAYNGVDGVIAHDKEVDKVVRIAEAANKFHILKYLHPYTYSGLRRIVPVRFRPLHVDQWEPNVTVEVTGKQKTMYLEMLVDSGADISTLPYEIGLSLGFRRFEDEVVDLAAGVNGTVEYVLRNLTINIEGHAFKAPFAWFLDENCDDILLGRDTVFDEFDIEFKQKDQTIIFRKRLDFSR